MGSGFVNSLLRLGFIIIICLCRKAQADLLVDGLPEGADCFHRVANRSGVCEPLSENCAYVLLNFKNNDIDPQICSYTGDKGRQMIICCPYDMSEKIQVLQTRFSNPHKARCETFSKYVFDSKNRSHCGSDGQHLIFGGTAAKGKEFPHMARIGYGEPDNVSWECGGTLISEQWVMTAAHCIDTHSGPAKFVRLGDLNMLTDDDDASPQNFLVLDRKKHPEYTFTNYDDIGLLKLNRFIIFTDYVRPACLWHQHELPSQIRAIASGWGDQGYSAEQSANLMKIILEIKKFPDCNATFPTNYRLKFGIDDSKQVCAGPMRTTEIKDTCPGDSGGPLQMYAEPIDPELFCMYYIVGITSFGLPCAIVSRPAVYTRVSHYLPWIESVVWPN